MEGYGLGKCTQRLRTRSCHTYIYTHTFVYPLSRITLFWGHCKALNFLLEDDSQLFPGLYQQSVNGPVVYSPLKVNVGLYVPLNLSVTERHYIIPMKYLFMLKLFCIPIYMQKLHNLNIIISIIIDANLNKFSNFLILL